MGPERLVTPISGCVICCQEADRIADCVRSLSFCDEIVVVDSGSTDATRTIAADLGARVVVNTPFPGFAQQRQFAIDQAQNDWVLCLDADERITPALARNIVARASSGTLVGAYRMPRRSQYLGRVMRHGLFWPDWKLRLFDRRLGRVVANPPHDHVAMREGTSIADLDDCIEHLNYRSLADHLRTIDSYSRQAAEAMRADGRRASVLDLIVRPPSVFVKSLLVKRGLLDGWRGLVCASLAAYHDWLKYWRCLRLLGRGRG